MYNPILHKDRMLGPTAHTTRSLPRPSTSTGWSKSLTRAKHRSRSRSPGRSQLSLVICPDFHEFPEGMREYSNHNSPCPSPSPMSAKVRNQFPFSGRHVPPKQHALARTRGTEILTDTASLPCSPVFSRLGGSRSRLSPICRELSLPSSPTLPRIHIQDFDPTSKVSRIKFYYIPCKKDINVGIRIYNLNEKNSSSNNGSINYIKIKSQNKVLCKMVQTQSNPNVRFDPYYK